MKRKGFTLVELLAVIVILAVIALIATPVVINMIEEARIGAFKDSVLSAYKAVENKLVLEGLSEIPENGIDVKTLELKSDFTSGRFIKDENGIDMAYFVKNNRYCAYGRIDNLEIKKDCESLDLSYPEVDENKMILQSTTESIKVILEEDIAIDIESGIKNYEVIIYLKDEKIDSKKLEYPTTVTFHKLIENTEYRVELIVTNGNDMKSTIEKNKKTEEMNTPLLTYINTPEEIQNGYLKEQTIKITYPEVSEIQNYVKTTREGIINEEVTKECGTGIMPGECKTISETKTLSENTWYQVDSKIEISYTEETDTNGNVYALMYDGTNYGASATGTISKIDKTNPSITITTSTSNTNRVVLTYEVKEEQSQTKTTTCQYGEKEDAYTKAGSSVTNTSCILGDLSTDKTYYYEICAIDNVGNEGCTKGNTKTETITNPTITFESTPEADSNGYTKKQVSTVTFQKGNINEPKYYVKTERIGESSINVSKSCGSDTMPRECKTITETKTLSENTWYEVSGNLEITYSEPATVTNTLYAITYDGTNYSGATTGTIGKIYYEAKYIEYSENGSTNVKEALDELYEIYLK